MTLALAGCGLATGSSDSAQLTTNAPALPNTVKASGPEADYPVVLGDAYKIDGVEYTPSNAWNYDAVGYATTDPQAGISASHKILPLPSYVEVTSLESGKTILVRVERRGPKTNAREIALSLGAQSQLGVGEGTPVRVRRVNPPENDRFALRSGGPAPERIDTPKSLVEVLRRKLPSSGSASLASAQAQRSPSASTGPAPAASPRPTPTRRAVAQASPAPRATRTPAVQAPAQPAAQPAAEPAARGRFAVQAAAFRQKANADRAAKAVGGFVKSGGGYHRVRTGPYTSRGQAEAALAKVRAAGYSDAQVVTAG